LVGLGFELAKLLTCKAGTLLFEPHQSIFFWWFWRWGLKNCLPRLASNFNSPYLSLPSS
jgi:hypothetical protein